MELTDLDIQNLKNQFIELLRSTKREGIEELINFLEKSDFLQHLQVQDFTELIKEDFWFIA